MNSVSVLIPIHNGERYLAQAIDSILQQTFSPTEIIAIDDGSTDGSANVVQACRARAQDVSVRYLRVEFGNTGRARNHGAELATGAFLAFLDQDDVWLRDKLARQLAAFERAPETEAVFGQVEQFRYSSRSATGEVVSPQMRGYAPSVMLIRRAAFWRIGAFDEHLQIGEWVDWYARAVDQKLQVVMLAELVARRRVHGENKGTVRRAARSEYARVLKQSLDRRRASGELERE